MGEDGDRPLTPLGRLLKSDAELRNQLYMLAFRQTGRTKDADDLFQDTIAKGLEGEARGEWSAAGEVPARRYLVTILCALAGNRRRRARKFPSVPLDGDDAPPLGATNQLDPERAMVEREKHLQREKLIAELRDELAKESSGRIPLAMLEWSAKGEYSHAEYAEKIGCTLPDIRLAQRRITYHAERLLARRSGGAS